MVEQSSRAVDFKDGDVVECVYGHYIGIVTTARTNEFGYVCLAATRESRQGGGYFWTTHPDGHTSGKVRLHPHPDKILAEFTKATLLGEVEAYD